MSKRRYPFQGRGGTVAFGVEGGAADENNGTDGAVGLFLLESGAEAVAAGVAIQAEGAGVVGDGFLSRVDEGRGPGDLAEDVADDCFRRGGEGERDGLLEEIVDWAKAPRKVCHEDAVVVGAADELTHLFLVWGIVVLDGASTLSELRLKTPKEVACPRKSASVDASLTLARESSRSSFRKPSKRAQILATWAVGSGSKTMMSSR